VAKLDESSSHEPVLTTNAGVTAGNSVYAESRLTALVWIVVPLACMALVILAAVLEWI
jgi:hypothetical protein